MTVELTEREAERIAELNSAVQILLHASLRVGVAAVGYHANIMAYRIFDNAMRNVALEFTNATNVIACRFPEHWSRHSIEEVA